MFPTNLTPDFDLDAMRKLVLASSIAYCKPDEMSARAYAAGATGFRFFDGPHDTQGFIAWNDTDVVIAFRGTESIADWITDCKFFRRKFSDFPGEIHDGFGEAFEAMRDELRVSIAAVMVGRRIWVTGHSLGGALALLCAYDIVKGGKEIAGCYTFGQPRVGDAVFATAYDANLVLRLRTFRLVNENDIVPRVPGVLIGYRHTEQEIFMDAFGKVDVDPSLCKKLASDVWGIAAEKIASTREKAIGKLVTDHFIANYLRRTGN